MTPQFPHFPHKAQQEEHRWLWPLIPSILAAGSFSSTVDSASLAAAAECQVTAESGAIQGMTAWKGITLSILPHTITVEQDTYGGLAPYRKNSTLGLSNAESPGIATADACMRQEIRKRARVNQATIKPIVKTQAKAFAHVMKFSGLSSHGKREVRTIRTAPLEIGISARDKVPVIIGPVEEFQNPILPDMHNASQTVTALASTVEFPSLYGGQPFVAVHPFQTALQLPDNESLRMNLMTEQALHDGNCSTGCP